MNQITISSCSVYLSGEYFRLQPYMDHMDHIWIGLVHVVGAIIPFFLTLTTIISSPIFVKCPKIFAHHLLKRSSFQNVLSCSSYLVNTGSVWFIFLASIIGTKTDMDMSPSHTAILFCNMSILSRDKCVTIVSLECFCTLE